MDTPRLAQNEPAFSTSGDDPVTVIPEGEFKKNWSIQIHNPGPAGEFSLDGGKSWHFLPGNQQTGFGHFTGRVQLLIRRTQNGEDMKDVSALID